MERKIIFYYVAGFALLLGLLDFAKTGERYFLSCIILILASIHIVHNSERYKKSTVNNFGKAIFIFGIIGLFFHFSVIGGFKSLNHLLINLANIIIGYYLWMFLYVKKDY